MLKKRVTAYTAELLRPDCIVLRNRGAIVAHIHKVAGGWKVIPSEAGRRPSRILAKTAAEAATRYFIPSAGQAVQMVEPPDNGNGNGHDAPEKVDV